MTYVVLELQTGADGAVGSLVTAHASRGEAESKFHAVLAAAAVSALPAHAAVLMDSEGTVMGSQCYTHAAAAAGSEG